MKTRRIPESYLLLSPALFFLFLISIYPFVYALYLSVHSLILYRPGVSFAGLENFRMLFAGRDFANSFQVSILFTLISVGASFLVGLILALALNEKFRGCSIFRTIFTLPLTIAPVVAGFGWRFMLEGDFGVITASLLPALGIKVNTILGSASLAIYSIIAADVWIKTPLVFLILLAGLQAIPVDLYEAGKVDGASSFGLFRHVTLPLLKYPIMVSLVIRTIDAINAFDLIYVMTRGGPGTSSETLAMLGWRLGFVYFDMGLASALAVFIIVLTLAIAILMIRSMTK